MEIGKSSNDFSLFYQMKRSRMQIFLVFGLLGLLGVLAFFQYVWLGQISDAEKDRLTRRLQTDTERFAEDFNREMQSAFVNFQAESAIWEKQDWQQFNERYDFWREKTAYPNLITDFYYFAKQPDSQILHYDSIKREFVPVEWNEDFLKVKTNAADLKTYKLFDEERFSFVVSIYQPENTFEKIMIRREKQPVPAGNLSFERTKVDIPESKGFLVIKLNENVVKENILPDLVKKHFPENDFNLSVAGKNGERIFQTNEVTKADSTANLFDLSPENLIFFSNRDVLRRTPNPQAQGIVINQSVQTHTSTFQKETIPVENLPEKKPVGTFTFELKNNERPRTVIRAGALTDDGNWTLSVQHSAGSLDNFIAGTRNKNLAISFGILGLLGATIILVFVSAQRARIFAQRQVDFVSSVSHEFRTPLAVIYSAGENLADGVAREESQVSRYGNLIKSEGKKLSAMVEQILEFAGANAGRKKYDLRENSIDEIVENALSECRNLIDEKGFTVEKDLAENLPTVKADAYALNQAIQNLIGNSVKYSNGSKYIKIETKNGDRRIKISVEDRGIGIAPQDLKYIFEPFYRAKSVVDEQIHGNGLGLSLVEEIVKAHGGKVKAESEIGKGSKFTIELPLS